MTETKIVEVKKEAPEQKCRGFLFVSVCPSTYFIISENY